MYCIARFFNSGATHPLDGTVLDIQPGFIYNDIFSKTLEALLYWMDWPEGEGVSMRSSMACLSLRLNPAWHGADQCADLQILKMKNVHYFGFIHVRRFP